MLSPDVVALLERSVLCWLATASPDGDPTVSPKEIFLPAPPDHVLIADIASPRSVGNIAANARVCLSAVDVFDQRGYQLYGRAERIGPDDPRFAGAVAPLRALAPEDFVIRHVIDVTVERVSRIVAPSYWVRPEVDDDTRRAGVYQAYGVRPAE